MGSGCCVLHVAEAPDAGTQQQSHGVRNNLSLSAVRPHSHDCSTHNPGYDCFAMIDIIKKTLLAGVGAAVLTKDKVEAALGDFVQQGKVSAAEAKAMAEKVTAEGRQEFETLSAQLGEKIQDLLSGIDQRAQKRLDALELRVAALERAAATAASEAADKIDTTPEG